MKFKRMCGGQRWENPAPLFSLTDLSLRALLGNDAGNVRCACRGWGAPGGRDGFVGFRCCFSPFFVNDKRKVRK